MVRRWPFATARVLWATCFLSAVLTVAAATSQAHAGTGFPQTGSASTNNDKSASKQSTARLLWADLTQAQRQVLAPLATEWDKIEDIRKKKWLKIANKFSIMKPSEQQRMQERMRDWAKLTPEQRRVARESYARSKKLNPAQKSAQWRQYQQLPEEQKKKLAADAASKKHVANLPSTYSKNKTVPPIKSTLKPVLEQSVTPQVANQSLIQPSAPPSANK